MIGKGAFIGAKAFAKKHYSGAVKSIKELKVGKKLKSFTGNRVRTTAALGIAGTAAGGAIGYGHGKHKERKRAKGAIMRFSLAESASQLGYKGKAWKASPAQRLAIIKRHNKNVDKRRAQYQKFYG